jgi:hypothetical protein
MMVSGLMIATTSGRTETSDRAKQIENDPYC